jgi:hypothetical protein
MFQASGIPPPPRTAPYLHTCRHSRRTPMSSGRGAMANRVAANWYGLWDVGPAPRPRVVPQWRHLQVRKQSVVSAYRTRT